MQPYTPRFGLVCCCCCCECRRTVTRLQKGRVFKFFKDLKLRGRALLSEMASTLVESIGEGCLVPTTQVEYCSQDAALQKAVEIVQMRTHIT
eukprot:3031012-Amphidinium_carterae.1